MKAAEEHQITGIISSHSISAHHLYQHLQQEGLTSAVVPGPFQQDVDVDFEPLVFALAGIGAFSPVVRCFEIFNPALPRHLHLGRTVVVVNHPAVQQTHGREVMDAVDWFGDGRVDVGEGVFLWGPHRDRFQFQFQHL